MREELGKILNDLGKLSLTEAKLEQLHQYQAKLEDLEDYVSKHENDGEIECMVKATKAYMHFQEKISHKPFNNFDYLRGKIAYLGWKNEGVERNKTAQQNTLSKLENLQKKNLKSQLYALLGIAAVDYDHGNYEACIESLNKANDAIYTFDFDSKDLFNITVNANIHNRYGLAYRAMNNFETAISHFEKSLSILELFTEDTSLDAPKLTLMNNIGAIFTWQKKWQKGLTYFLKYYPFAQQQLNNGEVPHYMKVQLGTFLINMSLCYTHLNMFNKSNEKLLLVEKITCNIDKPYFFLKANLLCVKCTYFKKLGNHKAALECAQKAFQYVFPHFKSSNLHDNPNIRQADFDKMQQFITEPFVTKAEALMTYFLNERKDISYLKNCLNTIDRIAIYFNKMRSNYIGQQSKFSLAHYTKNLYETGQLACWHLYQSTLNTLYIEKAFAYANSSKALVLLDEMNKKWFESSEENISIEKIKSKLNNNEMLLEYAVGEKCIFIYSISKTKEIQFFHLNKDEAATLERQVTNWLNYHFNIYSPTKYTGYQKEAYQIYTTLLGKVLNEIEDHSSVIISPDGFLNTIPFEALVYKKKELNDYKDIRYVIDRVTIGYSFSSYLFYLNRKKEYQNIKNNFLYVTPNFLGSKSLEEHQQIVEEQKVLLQKASLTEMNHESNPLIHFNDKKLDLTLIDDNQQIVVTKAILQDLLNANNKNQTPKALIHNAALAKILKETITSSFTNIEILQNEKASKREFINNINKVGCVLVSSHADEENGILFYDEDKTKTTFLNYDTIVKFNIKTQLVVLNMCDSGKGKSIFGEGYLSLGRAFFAAGSLNVIQTLYKVSDKYSANLIASFFKYLIEYQLDFCTALRKAKLLLRNEKSSHPKFWAGHVIYGKNGKL